MIAERLHEITLQTADKKTFTLSYAWYLEPPTLSFSGGDLNSTVRKDLISALQQFVDSKVTPSQARALQQKVDDAVDWGVLTKEEQIILQTTGFIQDLKNTEISEQAH